MSNELAIATVTAALQRLLNQQVPQNLPPELPAEFNPGDLRVTTRAPDKARNGTANQLNLFLYQTVLNPGLRNSDMPGRSRPNEQAQPPLALDLYYLLTAYGRENDEINAQILLGQAMRILHDHALFSPTELRNALPGSDVHDQIERVRIRVQPLSVEELSKLWTVFQTNYHLSVAYQVAVVLIESRRAVRAALPVLQRGAGDRGPVAQANLDVPFPLLFAARPAGDDPSLELGGQLLVSGQKLAPEGGTAVNLRFTHTRLETVIERPVDPGGTAEEVRFTVPAGETDVWHPGLYRVAALLQPAGDTQQRVTNDVAMSLAPAFSDVAVARVGGAVEVELTVSPNVDASQQVALLLGDREVPPRPFTTNPTESLRFRAEDVAPGDYFIRLRIDGVDSLLIDRSVVPPAFKATHRITVPS
jgi:hypothetical protein